MFPARGGVIGLLAGCALALSAAPAPAVTLPGSPLTVHVGERGQMQAFRAGEPSGIFFPPSGTAGDAGFFLALPDATTVYGFDGAPLA